MKRQPSTSIPDLAASLRRKRRLSEEERALGESFAKQTKPLRKKPRAAKAETAAPAAEALVAAKSAAPPKPLPSSISRAPRPDPPPAAPPLAPLGRRERSQLSRGRKEIDARLDLHGMTQTRAPGGALTFVLVITGKGGRGAESERGVLRRRCRNG